MTFIISQSWFDYSNKALNDIEATKDKLRKIIASIPNNVELIKNNDARINLFIGVKKILQSVQFGYGNIKYCLNSSEYWENVMSNYNKDEIPYHIKEFNVFIMAGWIYGMSTIIEESFRALLKEIKPNYQGNADKNFKSLYEIIFKELNLQKHNNLFDLFRNIRNGIHTNQVFLPRNGKNALIVYKGVRYEFIVNKKMEFMNFDVLNEITSDITSALEDIVKHEKVRKIVTVRRLIVS